MNEKKRIEVDLLALLKLAKDDKKTLTIWCIVFGIISIVYAFTIPRIYTSSVTLAPESSSGNNLTSGISSLASMVGVNLEMGGGYDAIYPEIYPDLMSSKDFQVSMFSTKVKSLNGEINTNYYDYLDTKQKVSWMLYPFNLMKSCASSLLKSGNDSVPTKKGEINPKRLTKKQYDIANDIGSNIKCTVDKKTKVITISATAQDPYISTILADSAKEKLQYYITQYRTNKARNDVKYMEKLYHRYKNDDDYSVHVVPIPYYYRGWDGAPTDEVFDTGAYPGEAKIEDYRSFNLAEMHPAKIVVQNPFDEWNKVMTIPSKYYSSNIRQYTDELVYVPFFVTADFTKEDGREYVNMDHYVCMPGVINADRIVLPSEVLKKTYIEKIMEFAHTDDVAVKEVLNNRIVVCPEIIYCEDDADITGGVIERVNGKKTILFYTTISFLAENGNKAIEKINRTLDLFSENAGKIRVLWVTQGIREYIGLLEKKVADDFLRAKEKFENLQIGEYIEDVKRCDNKKYAAADAYYGDPSSIALQFFYNHKPVMIENANV